MAYVCNDWDPHHDDRHPCNEFLREISTYIYVDRDGDYTNDYHGDGSQGAVSECANHATDIEWSRDHIGHYQEIAWNEGCGFCTDCECATFAEDNYDCDDCGDRWPLNATEAIEEDDEDDTPTPRRPQTAYIPGRGQVAIPSAATHGLL